MARGVCPISEDEREENSMIEDYAIKLRIGRVKGIGRYEITKNGKRREKTKFVSEFVTAAGTFEEETWAEKALQEIEKCHETELLEDIKEYCRLHCAWMNKEKEIEKYAMECICSRAYLHWEDFDSGEIIWM